MHLIWLSLIAPPMLFLVSNVPFARSISVWTICLCVATAALAIVIGLDLLSFLNTGGERQNLILMIAFSMLRSTDYPFTAFFVSSLTAWGWVRFGTRARPGQKQVSPQS